MLDLLNHPLLLAIYFGSLVLAITIHEFAHAWMANHLGDPTPKLQGRLTLNPLAHLDLLGTLMLIVARFGWGKPVEFDPYNLAHPKRDAALISIAGPASNLILAIFLSIVFKIITLLSLPFVSLLALVILPSIISLNVALAIFNLIPIHPLDGGKILVGLLPEPQGREVDVFLRQYGLLLLLFIIMPFFGKAPLVHSVISPIINFILSLLLPSPGTLI